ncbi:hypothetical protein ACF087_30725 [Streptomyces goshikiensis]|uniref:hypothetical protein n=1 Tax=Streptomyces goshikiensis TaxID=1942 RepID=UPI0037003580
MPVLLLGNLGKRRAGPGEAHHHCLNGRIHRRRFRLGETESVEHEIGRLVVRAGT